MFGRLCVKTIAAVLIALAVAAAPAAADPIGGGHTTIKLSQKLYARLSANDVTVQGLKPSKVEGRSVTLPVSSGLLESVHGTGYLFYDGAVRLRAGGRHVVLRKLLLNTSKGWLRATIDGTKLFIAETDDQRARRDGFDKIAVALRLRLTARAAKILSRRLRLHGVFQRGRLLGSAASVAARDQVMVTGGTITVALDEAFRTMLQSLGVEALPLESTEASPSPQTFALPALVSFVGPDLSWGNLYSETGFVLKRPGTPDTQALIRAIGLQLESDLITASITLDPSPPLQRVFGTVPLGAARFMPQIDPRTLGIYAPAAVATLSSEAAAQLNEAFSPPGETAFSAGEPFAAFSFTAQTQ